MSSNEKTKQKLMETMRMTKADSSKAAENVDTKQTKTSEDDKNVLKKNKSTSLKKGTKDNIKASVDPYQSVRRVWPD